jgi:hypothetical protein
MTALGATHKFFFLRKLEGGVILTSWPADEIERWPLDKLMPYARNARTHSEDQVAQIAAAITEWGLPSFQS